eukprot:CAMPEP_0172826874 /NCGR_PEP_ID=MMETSP1075-20121228/19722_1 /TAXON_ID=2916 /ORGANISM="Ceratium fusus, Strain PA161109" /LENGTH=322 /DNA_ID=CAMNT_0013668591 /DNA_START=74 /DNA_END=1042 /DNA_ORIENTATION=-
MTLTSAAIHTLVHDEEESSDDEAAEPSLVQRAANLKSAMLVNIALLGSFVLTAWAGLLSRHQGFSTSVIAQGLDTVQETTSTAPAFSWHACVDPGAFHPPLSTTAIGKVNATAADVKLLETAVAAGNWTWPIAAWSPADIVANSIKGIFKTQSCAGAFNEYWLRALQHHFRSQGPEAISNLHDFLHSGVSNGYKLFSSVILAEPNKSFNTHIHASIEYVYVMAGELQEIRLVHCSNDTDFLVSFNETERRAFMNARVALPARSDGACTRYFTAKSGDVETNGIGSVHISKSGSKGLALLAFFSGLASHVGTGRELAWHAESK